MQSAAKKFFGVQHNIAIEAWPDRHYRFYRVALSALKNIVVVIAVNPGYCTAMA
ncbi:MAG: hypothetical protein AAF519_00785 [Bacteroidota bacterium]